MIVPNNYNGNGMMGDLFAQEKASHDRHAEPASPVEFL